MTDPSFQRLYQKLRDEFRVRGMSPRTEASYIAWVEQFVHWSGERHPNEMGIDEVNEFIGHLAVNRRLSPSSRNQAASALQFLYRRVLGTTLPASVSSGPVRAKLPKRLPTVLSKDEVSIVLRNLSGTKRLIGSLLYGAGLRLKEALSLRIKDANLGLGQLVIREAKGSRDRVAILPESLRGPFRRQIERRQELHQSDLDRGAGWVELPHAWDRAKPNLGRDFGWEYLFASSTLIPLPHHPSRLHRFHLHPSAMSRAVGRAARRSGLSKRVTCHTFRHSFATHLLQDGYDIRTIQELLGHRSVKTTMIYTHVLNRPGLGVRSPLDTLARPT